MNIKEKSKLLELYDDLKDELKLEYDITDGYTVGYRLGHINGQLELLEQILSIDTGSRIEFKED